MVGLISTLEVSVPFKPVNVYVNTGSDWPTNLAAASAVIVNIALVMVPDPLTDNGKE